MNYDIKTKGANNLQINFIDTNEVLYFQGTDIQAMAAIANKANKIVPVEGKFNAANMQYVELVREVRDTKEEVKGRK